MITCRDTLDWLLEAEPSELRTPVNREIAEHLASCKGCRNRSVRIIGDSDWLARAIPVISTPPSVADSVAPASSRAPWRRPAHVGTALIAASLLIVFLTRDSRSGRNGTDQVDGVAVAPAIRHETTESVTKRTVEERVALKERAPTVAHSPAPLVSGARLPLASAIQPVLITSAFVPPTPARAVRLDMKHLDSEPTFVEPRASFAVDAGPSTGRYAVLQSTPKVTVVWFY